jgi:threonine-phosphate decarboxylase
VKQATNGRAVADFRHGGNVHAFARAADVTLGEVVDFSASMNPLGMPRRAHQAYRAALQHVVHYPEPYAESLTRALAAYHDLEPAQIVVGNGSTQLIYALGRALALRRVLLIAPLFSEHAAALRVNGIRVEHFLLRPPTFALRLDRLAATLDLKRPDALVLANPNSPTGTLVERAQMEELVELCRRMKIKLIVDETFIDWSEEASIKQLAARNPQVVVLRSLTKFFAIPGLRVGYVVSTPAVVKRVRAQLEPWSVNTVAQEVGVACLHDQAFIARSRASLPRERAWFAARLAALPSLRVFPSSANFLLVHITTKRFTAVDLANQLAKDNLLIRVCDNFAGLGQQFFRVAVRKRAENLRLLKALPACGSRRTSYARRG